MQETAFSFFNPTRIYQFKAKKSEKSISIGLRKRKHLKKFYSHNMKKKKKKKKSKLNRYVYGFSVDYNIIVVSNITNIHKFLMKKT